MSSVNVEHLFAGMVETKTPDPWRHEGRDYETALACPVCTGSPIGQTASSCSHPVKPWASKVPCGPCGEGDASCGLFCVFELCDHVIEYRLRFHKGDVYLEWRLARPIEVCT